MNLGIKIFAFAFCCFVLPNMQTTLCQVRLPRLISDGMVLQRDTEVKVWGWAAPGEEVKINFNGKSYSAVTGSNAKWSVRLSLLKTGGPYDMEINASNRITIKDILIGDVWICSGQSNMETPMSRLADKYEDEIANCDNPMIRHFVVPLTYNFKAPQEDITSGKWEPVNSESIMKFAGVGYFFAKELFNKYKVPIGLIRSSVGGSPIDAWINEDALKEFPASLRAAEKFKNDSLIQKLTNSNKTLNDNWYKLLRNEDKGINGEKPWYDISYDASDWQKMYVPSYWADEGLGYVNGAVWFRKEIDVPASFIGRPVKLWLGRIVDADSVYVNGKYIGSTSYQYPPRKYLLPPDLLREGKNIIVVRVISNVGKGGFVKDKPYVLKLGKQEIDLKGEWQYKLGAELKPLIGLASVQNQPIGFFNGMIAPLLNYSIKGVIWYQGESDTNHAKEYEKLFSTLIKSWRQKWNEGNFPFLYVQLPNFMEEKNEPSESNWAELREAQLKTLSISNTAMAVAIDLGEWNDIHPQNKKDVGYRIALAAQKTAYNEDVVYSGPIYQSSKIEGSKIVISFSDVGSGLIVKGGGDLNYFAIAGADRNFVWAKAKIENDKVVVWNDQLEKPLYVRYAWADNPEGANLYNEEGLPASPFRTDE